MGCLALCATTFGISRDHGRDHDVRSRFDAWVKEYRIVARDGSHRMEMFDKWQDNDGYIKYVNGQNLTYSLGHNAFSGMDSDDFSSYIRSRGYYAPHEIDSIFRHYTGTVPESVDWVEKGGVTPVKNQGQCGSCWSFSTTGALEGAYFVTYGTLPSFSEQQLVDCDNFQHGGKDHGCNGGLMDNAFSWISKNGGLCSEDDYPYVSGTTQTAEHCDTVCAVVKNSGVVTFVDVQPDTDEDMLSAVAQQPVSIAIQADQREFQLYSSGVFTGACGTNLDHGVLVVGYGNEDGEDYYKVKNSWGDTWGRDGYIYLGRGAQYNGGQGQCGMLLQGSYPLLEYPPAPTHVIRA